MRIEIIRGMFTRPESNHEKRHLIKIKHRGAEISIENIDDEELLFLGKNLQHLATNKKTFAIEKGCH